SSMVQGAGRARQTRPDRTRRDARRRVGAQPVEVGKTSFAAGHRLAVEQAGGRLERVQRLHDQRKAFGPIIAVAGEKPRALGTAPSQDPEAIVLYLVNPVVASRRPLDLGWQARLAEI